MSTSFLLSDVREKPFATGTAHFINPHVTTVEESNLLDDRIAEGSRIAELRMMRNRAFFRPRHLIR
jgi:hypothetical protein